MSKAAGTTAPGAYFFVFVGTLPEGVDPETFEQVLPLNFSATANILPQLMVGAGKALPGLAPAEVMARIERAFSPLAIT